MDKWFKKPLEERQGILDEVIQEYIQKAGQIWKTTGGKWDEDKEWSISMRIHRLYQAGCEPEVLKNMLEEWLKLVTKKEIEGE